MLAINKKRIPFVRTNGHNLWINVVAQELLNNPKRVDVEIDAESNRITIHKNDRSGMFSVTHARDKQCKISTILFLKGPTSLKDRKRFAVQGGNGTIWFSYRQAV